MELYANRLSTKEADNMSLQKSMENLQEGAKNLNAEVASLKKLGQSVATSATNMDKGIMVTKWKREG